MNARAAVSIGAVLLVWQAVAASGWIPAEYFPDVPAALAALIDLLRDRQFWLNEGLTLLRAAFGLLLAIAIGTGAALAAARWPTFGRALNPLVELFRSMPPAPLVPLAIFALGLGAGLFLFIITFAAVWPIYVGASNALAASDPVQVRSARAFGLSPGQILLQVRLPAALPEMFSALRIAAGVALIASIAAEMLAGRDGIGAMLFTAAFSMRTAETFALLFVAGLNGVLLNGLVQRARRAGAGWHDLLTAGTGR